MKQESIELSEYSPVWLFINSVQQYQVRLKMVTLCINNRKSDELKMQKGKNSSSQARI